MRGGAQRIEPLSIEVREELRFSTSRSALPDAASEVRVGPRKTALAKKFR